MLIINYDLPTTALPQALCNRPEKRSSNHPCVILLSRRALEQPSVSKVLQEQHKDVPKTVMKSEKLKSNWSPLLWRQAGRDGAAHPGEGKTLGRPQSPFQ